MTTETDVSLADGRTLHVVDSGGDRPAVLVQNGSPHTGALLPPLLRAAEERGLRLVSYARPGYGGSTAQSGRVVAGAASDTTQVLDALGIERAFVLGYSGGGPHALAAAALAPDRVRGVATFAGIAPLTDAFDWWGAMADASGLQASSRGRADRLAYELSAEFNPEQFVAADYAALEGEWGAVGHDAGAAAAYGPDGMVDDDVSFVRPWGFDLAAVTAPVLLVQGGLDRVVPAGHAHWMLGELPAAQLWLRPADGHVAVLGGVPVGLDWLRALD